MRSALIDYQHISCKFLPTDNVVAANTLFALIVLMKAEHYLPRKAIACFCFPGSVNG
jgi:hypothetical protein